MLKIVKYDILVPSQDMKRLTIIVPIYNVEKYLNECLDSFVKQTDRSFSVLLIDDGSTDSSGEIAKKYEKDYPDLFKYIYQENKGLGGARNTGLVHVETDYVMFFDSDDFMATRAVEHINAHINKYETEIVFFNPIIYDVCLSTYYQWHDKPLIEKLFSKEEIINPSKTPELMLSEASVCRAIWKVSFLKRIGLKFPEKTKWEDVPPHFLVMKNAESASFMRYEGAYFYRANTRTSITAGNGKTRLEMKGIFDLIEPYFLDKSWPKIQKAYMIGFLSNYLGWCFKVIEDEYVAEFTDICHTFIRKVMPLSLFLKYFFSCKLKLKKKLLIYALRSNCLSKKLKNLDKIKSKMAFLVKIKRLLKR